MEWQPIETAPKDGTQVLLCEQYEGEPTYMVTGYFEGSLGWLDNARGDYTPQPTHWMPLPAPPVEEAEAKAA